MKFAFLFQEKDSIVRGEITATWNAGRKMVVGSGYVSALRTNRRSSLENVRQTLVAGC